MSAAPSLLLLMLTVASWPEAAPGPRRPAHEEAEQRLALAEEHLRAGRLDAAQQVVDEVIARCRRSQADREAEHRASWLLAEALNLRGVIASHKLDPDAAASDWHEALALLQELDECPKELSKAALQASIIDNYAADLCRHEKYIEALAVLDQALCSLRPHPNRRPDLSRASESLSEEPTHTYGLWLRRAEVLQALGRRAEALVALQRAAAAADRVVRCTSPPPHDWERIRRIYTTGADIAFARQDAAAALAWVERGKALRLPPPNELRSASPPQPPESGPGSDLSAQISDQSAELAFQQALHIACGAPIESARTLLAALAAQLLVEYYVGSQTVHFVAVTADEVRMGEVPLVPAELEAVVEQFCAEQLSATSNAPSVARSKARTDRRVSSHAQILYRHLLAPCDDLVQSRVLLIPDGPLRKLPFDTLQRPPDGSRLDDAVQLLQVPSLTGALTRILSATTPAASQAHATATARPAGSPRPAAGTPPLLPAASAPAGTRTWSVPALLLGALALGACCFARSFLRARSPRNRHT